MHAVTFPQRQVWTTRIFWRAQHCITLHTREFTQAAIPYLTRRIDAICFQLISPKVSKYQPDRRTKSSSFILSFSLSSNSSCISLKIHSSNSFMEIKSHWPRFFFSFFFCFVFLQSDNAFYLSMHFMFDHSQARFMDKLPQPPSVDAHRSYLY